MIDLKELRQDYLNGKLTHDEYYLKYATLLGIDSIKYYISSFKLNSQSKLDEWDFMLQPIAVLAADAFSRRKISKKSLTLAEAVCISKAVYKANF